MKKQKENKPWILLLYQLPTKAETERVRFWRALQKLGSVSIKNSVSAFPDLPLFQKTVLELAAQIQESGGDAIVTQGNFLFGLKPESLAQTYNAQLDVEYKILAQEIRKAVKDIPRNPTANELMRWEHKRTKFTSQFNALSARSLAPLDGIIQCQDSLSEFEKKLKPSKISKQASRAISQKPPTGGTWVTRKDPHVDRLASAWLIKRRIDPEAKFLFVDINKYKKQPGHLRYDVYDGEFSHIGDLCTFEVLARHFKLKSSDVRILAEVIHDLDIGDQKYNRPETEGIRMALEGIARAYKDDHERSDAAMNLLDSLVLSFRS